MPATAQQLEFKAAAATLLNTDDEQGIVEALVSVTGIADRQGDIIVPGAYARTLTEMRPKGVRHHQWDRAVARAESIEEWLPGDARLPAESAPGVAWPKDAGALYVKARYNMRTQAGRDAYEDAKFYAETGDSQWSIGYEVPQGKAQRRKDGIRLIYELDLFEWSDVLHGAAPLSRTLSVKAGVDPDAKFDPSQPRDPAGQWSAGSGGGSGASGTANTSNGLPPNWLERVLAGDARYVQHKKPKRGGGKRGKNEAEQAEAVRRDRVDAALQTEHANERLRRRDADQRIADEKDPARKAKAREDEAKRRRAWQTSFDSTRDEERTRRREWAAQQRREAAKPKKDLFEDASDDPLGDTEPALGDEAGIEEEDPVVVDETGKDTNAFGGGDPGGFVIDVIDVSDVSDGADADDSAVTGQKAMERFSGSVEDLRDRVRTAADEGFGGAQDANGEPEWFVSVIGTWTDRVVLTRYASADGTRESYEIPYDISVDGTVTFGTAQPVEIRLATEPVAGGGAEGQAAAELVHDAAVLAALAAGAETKAGRTLSTANADRIREAVTRLLAVLDTAGITAPPADTSKSGGPGTAPAGTGEPKEETKTAAAPATVEVDPQELAALLAGLRASASDG